jgi:hypothetical protein
VYEDLSLCQSRPTAQLHVRNSISDCLRERCSRFLGSRCQKASSPRWSPEPAASLVSENTERERDGGGGDIYTEYLELNEFLIDVMVANIVGSEYVSKVVE